MDDGGDYKEMPAGDDGGGDDGDGGEAGDGRHLGLLLHHAQAHHVQAGRGGGGVQPVH